ncbi:SDR family oxidoreductase [Synechococcus sp. BA-124 BA4]|uniref:SDR family oxidoreductase n=1 Tax=Synechococcus sp. BA-124 BA4 TaxID=3110251 RepID=UPI002B1EA0D1|nr:SDR family oxidoreductase [Synechococcus sp. BA-124 BA4]MEA5400926.1 SDR family oxidoreductase [Synechococcus sp. BA-124 BA4]
MKLMVVGASRGLGRAFVEGLGSAGDTVIGVSRRRPDGLRLPTGVELGWIEADLAEPLPAVRWIEQQAPAQLDVLIYNLGVWEANAFSEAYSFLEDHDESIATMVAINITGALMLLRRLIPRLLGSPRPQLILTGSTSGLRRSGQPEVTFGASKFALTGIADALRESFRDQQLAVTCLQLGYLNTDDGLEVPPEAAAGRGEGRQIPLHDVIRTVSALLQLSPASFVRELVLPAIGDERF